MLKSIAATAVFALGAFSVFPGATRAADLDQVVYAPELPATRPVEVGSGWYIRGDIGYAVSDDNDAGSYRDYDFGTVPASYVDRKFDDNTIDSDWSASAGFGYHFTDWLRTDLTLEYTRGAFDGTTTRPCDGLLVGQCSLDQDFESWGFLAHGYVDLGTFVGFTPYVGGGAGLMRVDWKTLDARCTAAAGCQTQAFPQSHGGEKDWRFAYSLEAGVAYALTKNLKLDLGYRYLDIDDGSMFGFTAQNQNLGAEGVQGHDNGLSKHEVRAGLRYDLW